MRKLEYRIGGQDSGKRVQDILRRKYGFSARLIVKLKQYPEGLLRNGEHIRAVDRLSEGDLLTVNIREPESRVITPGEKPADVIFEDSDLLILNKPAFMPVHEVGSHKDDTLANAFAAYYLAKDEEPPVFRPVYRLDRDTSGLVAVGKNRHSAAVLTDLLKAGKLTKAYDAILTGIPPQESGRIDLPIERICREDIKRRVGENGQDAVTDYTLLRRFPPHPELGLPNGAALVRCVLPTGRTHQIRVHFSHIGLPLLGDPMYGTVSSIIPRQGLHCHLLTFPWDDPASGKHTDHRFCSPYPADMEEAMRILAAPPSE